MPRLLRFLLTFPWWKTEQTSTLNLLKDWMARSAESRTSSMPMISTSSCPRSRWTARVCRFSSNVMRWAAGPGTIGCSKTCSNCDWRIRYGNRWRRKELSRRRECRRRATKEIARRVGGTWWQDNGKDAAVAVVWWIGRPELNHGGIPHKKTRWRFHAARFAIRVAQS